MNNPGADAVNLVGRAKWLLIKPKMIGDTLLAVPAIQALKRAHPELSIDMVVRAGSEGVLAMFAGIERVLVTVPPDDEARRRSPGGLRRWLRTLRAERYALACDLSGTERGHFTLLVVRAGCKVASPPAADLHRAGLWERVVPTLDIPGWDLLHAVERDAAVLEAVLGAPLGDLTFTFGDLAESPVSQSLPDHYAVIHPMSRVAAKVWPEERWHRVMDLLVSEVGHVVLSSGPSEREVAFSRRLAAVAPGRTTVTAGTWPWPLLTNALRGARVFVGADTAVAHLAGAVGVASVVVWGPSHENIWAPWSDRCWLVINDRIVPAVATRRQPPDPAALQRSTGANRGETVERAIRHALAA